MRARETRAGGQHLARERGAKDSEVWDDPPITIVRHDRLVEFLRPESLAALACFCGLSVSELMERAN